MLKKYNQVFITFLFFLDLFFISLAWFLAYLLRFESGFIEVTKEIPSWGQHLPLLVIILLVCGVVFNMTGLYRTKRLSSLPNEIFDLIRAMTISVLIFVFLDLFLQGIPLFEVDDPLLLVSQHSFHRSFQVLCPPFLKIPSEKGL